ncbi:MAG: hypothetical protein K9M07_00190 [Simkaniaceae bacterium]|nr:hypothetical protein [Simkaniaceae bacterium]MCF7851642.1 hypothetical protein [Simkaniaceae bacterium]
MHLVSSLVCAVPVFFAQVAREIYIECTAIWYRCTAHDALYFLNHRSEWGKRAVSPLQVRLFGLIKEVIDVNNLPDSHDQNLFDKKKLVIEGSVSGRPLALESIFLRDKIKEMMIKKIPSLSGIVGEKISFTDYTAFSKGDGERTYYLRSATSTIEVEVTRFFIFKTIELKKIPTDLSTREVSERELREEGFIEPRRMSVTDHEYQFYWSFVVFAAAVLVMAVYVRVMGIYRSTYRPF